MEIARFLLLLLLQHQLISPSSATSLVSQTSIDSFIDDESESDTVSGSAIQENDIRRLLYRRQAGDDVHLKRNMSLGRVDKVLKSTGNALIVTRKEYLKKDWCKSENLIQRIQEDRCLSRTIINKFCYGQCNSFYIPKSPRKRRENNALKKRGSENSNYFEDEDLTGAIFVSCAVCRPKKLAYVTVTLRCPGLIPQLRRKRIQRIKQCKCIAETVNN